MEIKDILSEIDIKEIYKDIYASPEYRKMKEKYHKFRIQGNFAQMLVMSKKMKDYEVGVFEGIARRYIDRNRIVNDCLASMSVEDRKNLSIMSYGVYMLADVLEIFIMDINQLMKKNTEQRVCGFDKLKKALKEASKVVSHFDTTMSDEKASSMFGDASDNLYKLTFNKASSYYNKLKKHAESVNKKTARNAKVA